MQDQLLAADASAAGGKTLVVGVDFSDANRPALDAAIEEAKRMHARLAIVHALTPLAAPGLEPAQPNPHAVNNEAADILVSDRARAERWRLRAQQAGLPVEMVSRPGPPASVLVEEAQRLGAHGIVVGTHGRTGLSKVLLGSVAERVVAQSHVPVLVVPPQGPQRVVAPVPSSPTHI